MFSMESTGAKLAIDMSAELENIDTVCREVGSFIESRGLASSRFAVLLGLREALANAIIHGCNNDCSQTVRMELECAHGGVCISVRDEGEGFDWSDAGKSVPEPWSVGGRGLPIILEYFDEVSFNESGNAIRFSKQCRSEESMSVIKRDGGSAIVEPGQDIVASSAEVIKQELKKLLDEGVSDITIDLDGVDLVDSIGIGLLIATHNSLAARRGTLRLCNVSNDIASLLGKMRLDKHFQVEKA